MSVQSIAAGAAFIKLTLESAELKRGLDAAQNRVKQFAGALNAFSSKMVMLGPLLSASFLNTTRVFAAFDDQMRLTGAVTGATGKQFKNLSDQAKKLGRETSFTAAQVASGMAALGRMGFQPEEIQAAIRPMMDLARATGTDLALAAQIAANNLSVFKMKADQATDVADILTVTANGSAQTLEDLGEALKMAAPQASRAGATLRETAAMLGVLANMGIRGSLAGTALGKSFKRMADPKVQNYLRGFNIEVLDSNKELRKMQDILVDVAKAMTKMTGAERIAFAEKVFDARGSLGGGTLSVNTDKIDEMMQKLNAAKGAAAATAEEMDKGVGGSLRRLASAAEGVNIALGEIIATSFTPVIESISAFCLAIREAVGEAKGLVAGIMGVAGSALAVGVAVKGIVVIGSLIQSIYSPLAVLNELFSQSARKAAEAAAAEQTRAVATEARVAREIAAEKMKTANELAEVAQQKAALAEQAAAELKAMQARKTANDMAIADSNRIIAAKQAETAAIIAEEEKVIAAQHGRRGKGAVQAVQMAQQKIRAAQNEAAATVAAETEKQAAIKKTNIELAAQISAQNGIAAAAAKSATAATAAATKAAADYNACAKSAAAATAAETRLTLAKEIANKKDLARGALLSKIITMKKFRIAYTQREAAVIWATSIKSIAAAKAEAGASWLKTAGYYAEAVGAKVAAGATLMLNKAMLLVAANPVTAALIALAAGIYACRKAVALSEDGFAREAEAAKKAAAAIEERRAAGDRQRAQQQDDFRRLQQLQELARQGKITDDQMKEAATLAEDLQNVYGDLGIAVDSATKSITMMAQAQERLNQAMREKALQELGEEIEKQKQLILKLGDSLAGGVRHFFSSDLLGKDTETDEYTTLFGIDSVAKHDAPIKKQMADERKKLQGMYDRLKALRGGDKGAITGAGSTSQDRIAATEAEQQKKAEVAGYTDYLKNRDKKSEADRAGHALDKRFDTLSKDKSAAGRQVMSDFMAMLDNGLAAARREYQRKLQEAQSESSEKGADLSKGEKAELKRLQQTIDGMTEKIAGYRERIADGMAAAQAQVKTVSGFDAQGLMQMFGRKSERDVAAERTAKATEKSEKYLKDLVSKYSQGWAIS